MRRDAKDSGSSLKQKDYAEIARRASVWFETIRNRHFFALDAVLIVMVSALSFFLYNESFALLLTEFLWFTGLALLVKLSLLYRADIYRRYWLYAGAYEVARLLFVVAQSTLMLALLIYAILVPLKLLDGFNWPVLVFDLLLTQSGVIGIRLGIRRLVKWSRYHSNHNSGQDVERVLVVGTSAMGAMLVTEMQENPDLGMFPVGFVDSTQSRQKMFIRNVPVLGNLDSLEELIRVHQVDQVVVAWPNAPGKVMQQIVQVAEARGIGVGVAPEIAQVLDGQVTCNFVRKVQVADLLRRDPVHTDMERVYDMLSGQRVLVTGAGGSIGSELCRQAVKCKLSRLILLGHGENSLYTISNELAQTCPGLNMSVVIADIRDQERLEQVFERERPSVVFHAAAHKHVPLMESNVEEAITNNVLGTLNLLNLSGRLGVQHFVLISSDKAVNPTSVMGATKRIAELLVRRKAQEAGHLWQCVLGMSWGAGGVWSRCSSSRSSGEVR